MNHTQRAVLAAAATGLLATHTGGWAAGFAVFEQSVTGLGSTFAGGSAAAEDASTVFFNPAGMTRLEGARMQAGAHIIVPQAEFSNEGSVRNASLPGVFPGTLTGGTDDGGKAAAVPNFYYSRQMNDRMFIGIGVNAPYGLSTEYNRDWVGRYHAVESELLTVNINPSLAFKATKQLSIGAGLNVQYADATLSNALDLSTACIGVAGAACIGLGFGTPVTPSTDGFQELTADDWSFGYNLGALFEVDENTRFGIHYRSRITHDLKGKVDFTGTDTLAAVFATGALTDQNARTKLTIPETLSLSGFHRLNDRWAIMADATYTRWSQVNVIKVQFDSGQSDLNLPLHWENTWRLSAGVNHYLNDKWTLRAGATFDQSPTPSAVDRSARIPDADRIWVGVGASYKHNENLSFDVGYVHIFVDDPKIANADPSFGHRLVGSYDASVDIVSAAVNWRF